jgi:hypothetical protein
MISKCDLIKHTDGKYYSNIKYSIPDGRLHFPDIPFSMATPIATQMAVKPYEGCSPLHSVGAGPILPVGDQVDMNSGCITQGVERTLGKFAPYDRCKHLPLTNDEIKKATWLRAFSEGFIDISDADRRGITEAAKQYELGRVLKNVTSLKLTRDPIGVFSKNARSAVGIKQDGSVIIMMGSQVPEENKKGFSLPDMAEQMKKHGAVEALNLDGGSSSGIVYRGKAIYGRYEKGKVVKRPVKSVLMVVPSQPVKGL